MIALFPDAEEYAHAELHPITEGWDFPNFQRTRE
jgi:hypothetical protein